MTTHGTKEPYQHPFEAAMSAVVPLSKNQQNCDNIAWPGLIAQKREPRDHAIRGGCLRIQNGFASWFSSFEISGFFPLIG
jgi:hypothetical protein